jgi:hypothetical protein
VGQLTIRNNTAAWLWGIGVGFWVVLILLTWVLLVQGPPEDTNPAVIRIIFGVFWLFGIGATRYVFSKPMIHVTIEPERILILNRYPFKKQEFIYGPKDISSAEVIESKDSEGDDYFTTRVQFKDGRETQLSEGHSREICEQTLKSFRHELKMQRFR